MSCSVELMISNFGDSPKRGILLGACFLFGARGEIEIIPCRFLGEANSPLRGNDATSEKKNEVCVGVRGVRGAAPRGVFKAEPKPPPGEKSPCPVGD
jgi:hypothetical protein